MQFKGLSGFARGGSAILAFLAGCSGSGNSSTPARLSPQSTLQAPDAVLRQGGRYSVSQFGVYHPDIKDLSPGFATADAAKTGAIIVSDYNNQDVFVFTNAGELAATITRLSNPQGLAVEASSGNLYIANSAAADILVYKNDYKTLVTTLEDPGKYPVDVDIDQTTGVVGVANFDNSVSIYAKGATTPCVTVSSSAFSAVYFGGFGKLGWFYVDGFDVNQEAIVGVVKGGCSATTIDTLQTANTISFPGGIKVTPANKVVITDQNARTLYTYNSPQKNALGTPIATSLLSERAVSFAFTQSAAKVWIAVVHTQRAEEYNYPVGGNAIGRIHMPYRYALPIGIAVTPVVAL